MNSNTDDNYRILVVDDNPDIHADFKKILTTKQTNKELKELEAKLFDKNVSNENEQIFEVDFVTQGKEGIRKVMNAVKEKRPYALIFMDIRMPPGIDGIETIENIWEVDPKLEVVFCSAYSDFSLDDMYSHLKYKDQFLIIKKPFDIIEIRQTAICLCQKWNLKRKSEAAIEEAEGKLMQADKMACIGQLAAGVAHEINNPVGYINSNINTLQNYVNDIIYLISVYQNSEKELNQQSNIYQKILEVKKSIDLDFLRKDVVNLINESCEGVARVKQIIQDLKDFSREGELNWGWYNLHEGIDKTLNIVQNELKYKANIIKEYGSIPEIEAVGHQLNQVILNILINAGQAIQDKGTILIKTDTKDNMAIIQISDTGKGMDVNTQNKIFEPFFTTKDVGQGTGLGLSLSYGIIQNHNGSIEVDSLLGEGTTFTIKVPLVQNKIEKMKAS